MLPHSRAQGWGRAGKGMSGLLSSPSQCLTLGSSKAALPM